MKKKYLIAAIAILAITFTIQSSIAYFNAKDSQENVFTVGDIKITLTEDKWNPDEEHIMSPGVSFDKNPTVNNVGKNPAYVRIVLKLTNYSVLKNAVDIVDYDVSNIFEGYDASKWLLAKTDVDTAKDTITYTYNYHRILNVNESSDALFEKVSFPDELDISKLSELSEDLAIEIKADAIQSDSFDSVDEAFVAFESEA